MKKLLGSLFVMAAAITMFFATNSSAQSEGLTLAGLVSFNSAQAECVRSGNPWLDTGHCSALSGNCYAMSGNTCDPYARP